jgi:hypothetical protein
MSGPARKRGVLAGGEPSTSGESSTGGESSTIGSSTSSTDSDDNLDEMVTVNNKY